MRPEAGGVLAVVPGGGLTALGGLGPLRWEGPGCFDADASLFSAASLAFWVVPGRFGWGPDGFLAEACGLGCATLLPPALGMGEWRSARQASRLVYEALARTRALSANPGRDLGFGKMGRPESTKKNV